MLHIRLAKASVRAQTDRRTKINSLILLRSTTDVYTGLGVGFVLYLREAHARRRPLDRDTATFNYEIMSFSYNSCPIAGGHHPRGSTAAQLEEYYDNSRHDNLAVDYIRQAVFLGKRALALEEDVDLPSEDEDADVEDYPARTHPLRLHRRRPRAPRPPEPYALSACPPLQPLSPLPPDLQFAHCRSLPGLQTANQNIDNVNGYSRSGSNSFLVLFERSR